MVWVGSCLVVQVIVVFIGGLKFCCEFVLSQLGDFYYYVEVGDVFFRVDFFQWGNVGVVVVYIYIDVLFGDFIVIGGVVVLLFIGLGLNLGMVVFVYCFFYYGIMFRVQIFRYVLIGNFYVV